MKVVSFQSKAERARLRDLRASQILDTTAESSFDDIARLAASICGVPISAISLIDEDRQWFKASCGLEVHETPRDVAFCDHTIRQTGIFEVTDACQDARFASNPLVTGGPRIRFYAGTPLVSTQGNHLGALCVASQEANHLTKEQSALLAALARQVIRLIEERKSLLELQRLVDERQRSERRLKVQLATSRSLARTKSAGAAGRRLLRGIGQALDCSGGALWRLGPDKKRLACAETWRLPGEPPCEYLVNLQHRVLTYEEGWPGKVWASREPQMTGHLGETQTCRLSALAANAGFKTWIGMPVEVHGEVVAVFEWVRQHSEPKDAELLASLADIGRQVGQFLERIEAERELAAANACFHSIIEHSFSALVTMDCHGILELVNPAAERMFGYPPGELRGRHVSALLDPRVGPDVVGRMGEIFRQDGNLAEWPARRRDGTEFPIETAMFDFPTTQGRRFGASILDISERRAVDRLKQEFVSTVSHELRTPLTSIKGSLALLNAGWVGALSEEAHAMVALAERNCTRLIGLINDMLDLDRLALGQIDLQVGEIDLARLVRRSIDAVVGFAESAGICLVAESCEARLAGDEDRLVQALVNLLSNAIKFSPRGGTVTVAAQHQGDQIELQVRDEGRGIPADKHQKIFERFSQVDASDSRQKGGTGLGLAITKSIIELHQGEIVVDSEVGKGSVFRVRLPGTLALDEHLQPALTSPNGA